MKFTKEVKELEKMTKDWNKVERGYKEIINRLYQMAEECEDEDVVKDIRASLKYMKIKFKDVNDNYGSKMSELTNV